MKALVVLVHYFAEEAKPQHASVDASRRAERTRVIEQVVRGYRGAFGPSSTLRFSNRDYWLNPASVDVDLRVLTVPGHSLLSDAFRERFGVGQTTFQPDNPRMLGFGAYRLFAKLAEQYDWFIYSEDDLLVRDPQMFDKLRWFNQSFGDQRVLSPNRYEWNDRAKTQKTYIDGELTKKTRDQLFSTVTDAEYLVASPLGTSTGFLRALNPHAGFFAVTATQLAHWMRQPHWLDEDVSFYTPLESAATLGLTKTFPVYKPYGPSAGFLEIEHLDNRFSGKRGFVLKRPAAPADAT